jgi:hypothetical protein
MPTIPEVLDDLMRLDGALAVSIVDSGSGMLLGRAGQGIDIELAAAGMTELVRAKRRTIQALGLPDAIEDILITATSQYHVVRPLDGAPEIFVYLVLDTARANLALARIKAKGVGAGFSI